MPPLLVWLWDYVFQRKSLNEVSNTIYSLLQTQPLVASHQLRISFTFSFGYIILGYQSSSVPTVFCIWIIYIWSKDTQRNQSLKTTVASNLKYKTDKNSPVDIMARLFGLSQKLAPTRKIVPALSARFCNSTSQTLCIIRGGDQRSWIGHMRKTLTKLQTRPCQTRVTHCGPLEARVIKARWHFFYRHFLFLGNQEQVFLFSLLISRLTYALYWYAHFNTIKGTQSG